MDSLRQVSGGGRRRIAMGLLMAVGLAAGLLPLSRAQQIPGGQGLVASVAMPAMAGEVLRVGMTVDDLDRSVAFYTDVLDFRKISETEVLGKGFEELTGVFGARARVARLRLGDEEIELTEFMTPRGREIPRVGHSNDRVFQHIAIITSEMDKAYARLRSHKVRHVSTAPQRLPDWNPNAVGIKAFYFNDPDGHALETLQFPAGKGKAKWQEKDRLFLGIDHTAIVVADSDKSIAFYRDTLGMKVVGTSDNSGEEQAHLNQVAGAHLRITALRATARGPGVELLEYLTPRDGVALPGDTKANDLWHWETSVVGPNLMGGGVIHDPDGHAILLVKP